MPPAASVRYRRFPIWLLPYGLAWGYGQLGWIVQVTGTPRSVIAHGIGMFLSIWTAWKVPHRAHLVVPITVMLAPLGYQYTRDIAHIQSLPMAVLGGWLIVELARICGSNAIRTGTLRRWWIWWSIPLIWYLGLSSCTILRELDFHWPTSWQWLQPVNGLYQTRWDAVRIILLESGWVAICTVLAAVLLTHPRHRIVKWGTGLVWATTLSAGLAIVQMFQPDFFNPPYWAHLRRATGFVQDANMLGLWMVVGLFLLATVSTWPARWRWAAAGLHAVAWFGAASRTSLLWMVWLGIGVAWQSRTHLRSVRHRICTLARRRFVWLMLGLAAVCGLFVGGMRGGIGARLVESVTAFRRQPGIAALFKTRAYYWQIALAIIQDAAGWGIGPGSYRVLMVDYMFFFQDLRIVDSALNAYFQVLAELGWPGMLGLLGAVIPLLWNLLRAEPIWRWFWTGLLLVGWFVPPQHAASVFGLVILIVSGLTARFPDMRRHWIVLYTIGMTGIAVIHGIGFWRQSHTVWRPAARAYRIGWLIDTYGLYPPESTPDGRVFRWTRPRFGIRLPHRPVRTVHFTIHPMRPPGWTGPVHVRAWLRGQLIYHIVLTHNEWRSVAIPIPSGVQWHRWIHFRVHPGWVPAAYGKPDARTLGVAIHWVRWEAVFITSRDSHRK